MSNYEYEYLRLVTLRSVESNCTIRIFAGLKTMKIKPLRVPKLEPLKVPKLKYDISEFEPLKMPKLTPLKIPELKYEIPEFKLKPIDLKLNNEDEDT